MLNFESQIFAEKAKDFCPSGVSLYEAMKIQPMTKILCVTAGLLLLYSERPFAQPVAPTSAAPAPAPNFAERLAAIQRAAGLPPEANAAPALTKFSLDFPGGSPLQLAQAMEKALGKPLNVIINREDEGVAIPPLKLNDVVVPQLFSALEATSRKLVTYSTGFGNNYSQMNTSFGFRTADGSVSDTSVWYFHVEKPIPPPAVAKMCEFYPLTECLNRGFTVDDITTAIQTGWKLAGETSPPELNYHKETKLLIAYGAPAQLSTISQVLQALPAENAVHARAQTEQLAAQIKELPQEVDQLKKHEAGTPASPETGAGGLEEKSGK